MDQHYQSIVQQHPSVNMDPRNSAVSLDQQQNYNIHPPVSLGGQLPPVGQPLPPVSLGQPLPPVSLGQPLPPVSLPQHHSPPPVTMTHPLPPMSMAQHHAAGSIAPPSVSMTTHPSVNISPHSTVMSHLPAHMRDSSIYIDQRQHESSANIEQRHSPMNSSPVNIEQRHQSMTQQRSPVDQQHSAAIGQHVGMDQQDASSYADQHNQPTTVEQREPVYMDQRDQPMIQHEPAYVSQREPNVEQRQSVYDNQGGQSAVEQQQTDYADQREQSSAIDQQTNFDHHERPSTIDQQTNYVDQHDHTPTLEQQTNYVDQREQPSALEQRDSSVIVNQHNSVVSMPQDNSVIPVNNEDTPMETNQSNSIEGATQDNMADKVENQDQASSDESDSQSSSSEEEEDLFECGKCREKFTTMKAFMEHKNNRVCRKPKTKAAAPTKSVDGVTKGKGEDAKPSEIKTLDQGVDIIRAASFASGIDHLAAAAFECQKNENHTHDYENGIAQDGVTQEESHKVITVQDKDGIDKGNVAAEKLKEETMPEVGRSPPRSPTDGAAPQELADTPVKKEAKSPEAEEDPDDSDMVEISLAAFNINCSFCSSAFTNYTDLRQHFTATHRISDDQTEKLVQDIESANKGAAAEDKKPPMRRTRKSTAPRRVMIARKSPIEKKPMIKREPLVERKQAVDRKPLLDGDARRPGRPRGRKRLSTRCDVCDKNFSTRKNLRKHNKCAKHLARVKEEYAADAEGKRLKKCNHCLFRASSGKEMLDHIRRRHSETIEPPEPPQIKRTRGRPRSARPAPRYRAVLGSCPECGKQLKGKILTLHIKRCRLKNTLHTCSECGKQVLKKALYRHQRRCLNKKFYICPLCKHQSREKYDYSVHVNGHKSWMPAEAGDTPFAKDSECGEADKDENKNPEQDDTNKEQNNENHDTLDLSMLGLTPAPTPVPPPVDAQEQNEGANKQIAPDGQGEQTNNEGSAQQKEAISFTPVNDNANSRKKELKCQSCDNWYKSSELKQHMFLEHNLVKKFRCCVDNCSFAIAGIGPFLEHYKTHTEEMPFTCGCRSCLIKNAGKNNQDPALIKELKKQKLKEYYQGLIYKCTKCWVKFPTPEGLERHNQRETHNHLCPTCGKVLFNQRQLKNHMITHNDERNFLCEECGNSFKTQRDLKKHSLSHSDMKPYVCQECGKGFLFRSKLIRHVMTVHTNERPYKCSAPNCDKAFARTDKLRDHERSHLLDEPFHCSYCPKGFYRKDHLKNHEAVHLKEGTAIRYNKPHADFTPFICQECGKGFSMKNKLDRHFLTVHAKIKPFKCEEPGCEKTFSRKDKLRDHARTHLPYQPFHCRFCQKGFYRKDNLREHEVLHTKDYPCKCDKCPKGFMRPKLLARHIAMEHGNQFGENSHSSDGAHIAQLMPLKLTTKPKAPRKPKQPKIPVPPPSLPPPPQPLPPSSEAQTAVQNLPTRIQYLYQQGGSSMAHALQQAMQSVNAGAEGLPVSLPPEVLHAYHFSQHGHMPGKAPHIQDYPPIVGHVQEEQSHHQQPQQPQQHQQHQQMSPGPMHERSDFRLA